MRTGRYGWASAQGPQSCNYLMPAVLEQLRLFGARRVFDLGAGNGAFCRALCIAGYDVAGMEPDADGVKIAREQNPGVRFYQLSVEDNPTPVLADYPDGFDAVVSTEVIEHLYAPRQLPIFARPLLRTGGMLILTTPYHGYLKNLVISVVGGWDRHADPLWDGGHIKLFSRRTISLLLNEAGFRIVSFGGVGRAPYLWKSMVVVAVKE